MSEINDAAVEAGARALWAYWRPGAAFDFAPANRRNAFMSDARRVLTAALPHLTPAPSASVEEVHAVVDEAHHDSWDNGREYEASPDAVTAALLARFNITPKETDRD